MADVTAARGRQRSNYMIGSHFIPKYHLEQFVRIRPMAEKVVSQMTIVEVMQVLREGGKAGINYPEFLYKYDVPDWFVIHARSHYGWDWTDILMDVRDGRFFFPSTSYFSDGSITGQYLSPTDAKRLGEKLIQKLAALATTQPGGESVLRSLELDGFSVNKEKLTLIALEGPVSPQVEEDALHLLVESSGIPDAHAVLNHIADAHSLYTQGKYHSSLNESRNFIQALIDGIRTETNANGKHETALPGGTANRIKYLSQVEFFIADEKAAFESAWGSLSAGSHPGVPEREQARIGLILALEFGQLLLLKFTNWRANGYHAFS